MDTRKNPERIFSVDLIRVIAILLVALIHTSSVYVANYEVVISSEWWFGNIVDSFSRMSVPLFVLISGKLLLDNTGESISVFFKKRLSRIFLPFLFWGMVYLIFQSITSEEPLTLKGVLLQFIQGPVYYHFWFIYMILGLYFITPVLRAWIKGADRTNQLYFLIVWGIGVSLLPFIDRTIVKLDINRFLFTSFGEYIGCFVLGYFLWSVPLDRRKKWWLGISFVLGFMITLVGTFILTQNKGGFASEFYQYLTPNVLLMATAAFLLLRDIGSQSEISNPVVLKVVQTISDNSFAIYCMHVLWLQVLRKGYLGILINIHSQPLTGIIGSWVFIVTASLIVSMLMRKTRFLKIFT